MAEALRWWLALELLGLAALPLSGILFRDLPDRGYALSKPLGLLLAGWLAWVGASLGVAPFGAGSARTAALLVALASGATLLWHRGGYGRAWRVYLRERRAYVLAVECAFLAAFAAMTLLRAYMPEIDQTEKPMEYMYIQAAHDARSMPPPDLWLSGHPANYYYFGFYLVAFLSHLSGVAPAVAFNLGLAGTWALAFIALAGLGYNAAAVGSERRLPRALGALLAPLLVLLAGNVAATLLSWEYVRQGREPDFSLFWDPSRVVYDNIPSREGPQQTINEFPAFSFLLGDSHPHVMAMPVLALGVGFSLALLLSARRPRAQMLLTALGAGFVAGVLYMTNSWDVPALLALCLAAPAVGLLPRKAREPDPGAGRGETGPSAPPTPPPVGPSGVSAAPSHPRAAQTEVVGAPPGPPVGQTFLSARSAPAFPHQLSHNIIPRLRLSLLALPAIVAAAALISLPFLSGFDAPVDRNAPLPGWAAATPVLSALGRTAGVVWWDHTEARELVRVWGLHALLSALALAAYSRGVPRAGWLLAIAAAVLGIACGVALQAPVLLLLPVVALCCVHAWHLPEPAARWGFLLAAGGWSLVLLVELVYLRDAFESRMNTAFKFYFQAWQLLGVSSAVLVPGALRKLSLPLPRGRWLPVAAPLVGALLLVSLLYPYLGVRHRAGGGIEGLDGAAFLRRDDTGSYEVSRWLGENSAPSEVVLEATGGAYSRFARVATFGGRPTVLGWAGHEGQWRRGQPELLEEIGRRGDDVRRLYGPLPPEERRALLQKYGVRYIIYGRMEREMQEEAELPAEDPFEGTLTPVLIVADTVLYEVPP